MAHADWKRYYAPILSHKRNGQCRIWNGKLFRDCAKAYAKAFEINSCDVSNWRCIGVAAIRGNRRNPQLQSYMAKGANSK